jgi:hypothetical protein
MKKFLVLLLLTVLFFLSGKSQTFGDSLGILKINGVPFKGTIKEFCKGGECPTQVIGQFIIFEDCGSKKKPITIYSQNSESFWKLMVIIPKKKIKRFGQIKEVVKDFRGVTMVSLEKKTFVFYVHKNYPSDLW